MQVHPDLTKLPKNVQDYIKSLEQKANAKLTLKISEAKPATDKYPATKGGTVMLYGVRRMPLAYYANEWKKILDFAPQILAFIEEHKDEIPWGKNGQNNH